MNAIVQNQFVLTKRDARFHHSIHRLLQPCPKVELHRAHSVSRQTVEGYVAKKFADAYGATITEFMPNLLSLSCHHQLSSVAGLRSAQYHPLFLERYLNQSVEN
ncbi:MAG: thermostable hemolysin, partial [Pseudomonadales bacterium]|nr:thermostable hemolysin [Pseudomonadales bacterium]